MSDLAQQQVPEGYRQTDVGFIPQDWKVCDIGQFNSFVTSGSRGWADFYSEYGDLFVRITNMKRDSIYLDLTNNRYVSIPSDSAEGKRTSLDNGDVLISITADIGISSYVDESVQKPAYINQHIALVRFEDERINSKFVSYYLSSENIQKLFRGNTDQGAKAGMNLSAIRDIKFALPSVEEQTIIANILSDVDALITSLEKLIVKKRAIKTAAMQQLLTGKKRLPSFDQTHTGYKQTELGEIPEDWEVVELGNLAHIRTGSMNNQDKVEDGVYPFYVRSQIVERINSYSYECEAILVPGEGNIGNIFHYINGRFDAHQRVYVIRQFDEECSPKYLFYYMKENFGRHAMENSVKATVDSLRLPTFVEFKVAKPTSCEEQAVIAEVLSDIDKEIEGLEQRLTKTQQLKQGMMQELLTGRTRLV